MVLLVIEDGSSVFLRTCCPLKSLSLLVPKLSKCVEGEAHLVRIKGLRRDGVRDHRRIVWREMQDVLHGQRGHSMQRS